MLFKVLLNPAPAPFLTLGSAASPFLWKAFLFSHPSSTLPSASSSNPIDCTKPSLGASVISLITLLPLRFLPGDAPWMNYYFALTLFCCRMLFLIFQWWCIRNGQHLQLEGQGKTGDSYCLRTPLCVFTHSELFVEHPLCIRGCARH